MLSLVVHMYQYIPMYSLKSNMQKHDLGQGVLWSFALKSKKVTKLKKKRFSMLNFEFTGGPGNPGNPGIMPF